MLSFVKVICVFIHHLHLMFSIIIFPKYIKAFTCSSSSCPTLMFACNGYPFITIHFVFFVLILISYSSQAVFKSPSIAFIGCSLSANKIVSSEKWIHSLAATNQHSLFYHPYTSELSFPSTHWTVWGIDSSLANANGFILILVSSVFSFLICTRNFCCKCRIDIYSILLYDVH